MTEKERLDRETPMEVTEIHVDDYTCPACGIKNSTNGEKCVGDRYCPQCGQRLKTTEEMELEKMEAEARKGKW